MSINKIRLRIFLIVILIISTLLAIRILYLASQEHSDYLILENKNVIIQRGDILDTKGRLLATSDELDSCYANPKEIKEKKAAAKKLAALFDVSVETLYDRLKSDRSFVWIKRQIPPAKANILRSLNLEGIGLVKEYKRFYPNKSLASHILGFCNVDNIGQEGLEKSMNTYLLLEDKQLDESDKIYRGYDVYLTIDSVIQAVGEKMIARFVHEENADAGSLIMLDGKTGEIMCMANYPDYDPNMYQEYSQAYFRNYAIFNQFEPGSVLKIFSIASLLNNNAINEKNHFFCDGSYKDEYFSINCTGYHESINYEGIVKFSCNDAMLQANEQISSQDLYHYLKFFGFGSRTSIMLPGEQSGLLRDLSSWSYRSRLSVPLGQEISVNALQIIQAATFLINDGMIIEPYVVRKVINKNQKVIMQNSRQEIRRVVKTGISPTILAAMKTASEEGGTAEELSVPGITFAAKSGTGQIFDVKQKKYLENEFTSSLLVAFPLENPRYLMYVVFHKPKGEIKWGGVIGAKLINEFIKSLTGYFIFNENENLYIKESDLTIK